MSYKGFIYKYTSPSGKFYIGQTTKDPKKRAGYKGEDIQEQFLEMQLKNMDLKILSSKFFILSKMIQLKT